MKTNINFANISDPEDIANGYDDLTRKWAAFSWYHLDLGYTKKEKAKLFDDGEYIFHRNEKELIDI